MPPPPEQPLDLEAARSKLSRRSFCEAEQSAIIGFQRGEHLGRPAILASDLGFLYDSTDAHRPWPVAVDLSSEAGGLGIIVSDVDGCCDRNHEVVEIMAMFATEHHYAAVMRRLFPKHE